MNWHDLGKALKEAVQQIEQHRTTGGHARLNHGQCASLGVMAERLPHNGLVLADEVGMGKTRIATQLIRSVVDAGGRVAVVLPGGLGFQWQRELRGSGLTVDPVVRGILGFMHTFCDVSVEPWDRRNVVLLSHAFSNTRLQKGSDARRWILLPAIVAILRESAGHDAASQIREVKGYVDGEEALGTARRLVNRRMRAGPHLKVLREFALRTRWAPLFRPEEYAVGTEFRRMLRLAIGLGFGRFDLVVIDEAHKSRGDEAMLTTLLNEMLLVDGETRFLAMTATPVELDTSQWLQTLARIRAPAAQLATIEAVILDYAEKLKRVRQSWRTSEESRKAYADSAEVFQRALGDFVVRRDKREDEDIRQFGRHGGVSYRNTGSEIRIETSTLSVPWKHAICAAEALSLIADGGSAVDKRLRLTLASGHATSKFLDEDMDEDSAIESETMLQEGQEPHRISGQIACNDAAKQRAAWWRSTLERSMRAVEDPVYGHPAILAIVKSIEARTLKNEKVLVFGRYTRPMRALEQLLNARELLRRLDEGRYWPQRRIEAGDEMLDQRAALRVAHAQWAREHGGAHAVPLDEIDGKLEAQYNKERHLRERFRNSLELRLGNAIPPASFHGGLLRGLREAVLGVHEGEEDGHPVALLARALLELTGDKAATMDDVQLGKEFEALVDAVLDRDSGADSSEENADERGGWQEFQSRLKAEYGARTGGHARLMHGATKLESRRLMQQAFNRPAASPMVLIAQSLVGREGLNLHEACRVVILQHPEWNPAVVEQQIGRVDRVGSCWSKELKAAVEAGCAGPELPQIEVLPVVFEGTYDEHNWRVLRERWDDLRAQLHGEVIPPRLIGEIDSTEERALLTQLEHSAPNFSPTAEWRLRA